MAQQRSTNKKSKLARSKGPRFGNPAVTDPIADMLTRIRNAAMARHVDVNVPVSKMKTEIASILLREGYIRGFQLVDRGRQLRIRLKYDAQRQPAISGLKRVSKPGRRVYAGHGELPRVLGGLGVAILSTSEGVVTAREASHRGIGGEVVGLIW
jgi:small subunit ribosomal protein S8